MKEVTIKTLRKKNRARLTTRLRGKSFESAGFESLFGLPQTSALEDLFLTRTVRNFEELFCDHSVVYACVKKVAEAAVDAKVQVGVIDGDGAFTANDDDPLAKLFEVPNPDMDWAQFLWRMIQSLLLTGVSLIWEERTRGGQLDKLWPLPTSWVTRRFERGQLIGYTLHFGGGKEKNVPLADIVSVGFPDPRHPGHFCGPLQAASRDQQTDEERGNYLFEMMTNMTFPGIILHQDEPWTPQQKMEARAVLEDRVGRGRRGSPLFVEGENAKLTTPDTLKDLDWPGVTSLVETRICATFGVPPIVIGLKSGLEHGTYANFEQAERAFYRGTMPPLWRMLAGAFTRDLLRKEGDEESVVRFDFSEVPQLQEDATDRAKRAEGLVKTAIITRNEARVMAGFEPLPSLVGDVFLMPANVIPEPADGSTIEEEVLDEDDTDAAVEAADEMSGDSEEDEEGAEDGDAADDQELETTGKRVGSNGRSATWPHR